MAFTKVTLSGGSKDKIKAAFTKFNDLIDDLVAITSGKGASQIGVQDSGDKFTGTTVEAVLAELAASVATADTLTAVLDEDAATTTGLVWGYSGGTIGGTTGPVTVASGTLVLTDTATNYVEVSQAGVVSANTTGFSLWNIPIRTVVCAEGAQTTSTDSRAFLLKGTSLAFTAISSNTTAVARQSYICDTSAGAFTLTLPASPVAGDWVGWVDAEGTFAAYPLTIDRNSEKIMGLAENMTVSLNYLSGRLVYNDTDNGWRIG